MEARLRFLRLTGDDSCPFVVSILRSTSYDTLYEQSVKIKTDFFVYASVSSFQLQAGPPALFDVCEFLGLSFAGYKEPGNVVDRTHPAIVGTLCVSHHNHNPYHQTSMSAHDSMLFQNIILSITRVEQKLPQNSSMSRQMAYRSWTNWEVARETDRIWRDWWDGAPLTPPSSLPGSREGTPPHDSGFSEGALFNRCEKAMSNPDSLSIDGARGKRLKDLDIGKLIHRATMDVSITDDDPREHQYRWTSVDLDVYRVLLAYEERVSRSGLRAMVSAQRMLVI